MKEVIYVKMSHGEKLQAYVKIQMTRNQPKAVQNRRIFRELNNVMIAELPSKLIRQTLVSNCPLRVESLHTVFAVAVGLLQSINWH